MYLPLTIKMITVSYTHLNKSHAAAYAVVSYQTAYLKYYYPVEFMAALMTSVIDFPNKVAEYILEMCIRDRGRGSGISRRVFPCNGKR